jgi:hypothetical protein
MFHLSVAKLDLDVWLLSEEERARPPSYSLWASSHPYLLAAACLRLIQFDYGERNKSIALGEGALWTHQANPK